MTVMCAWDKLTPIPYPMPPEVVTLILGGGRDFYFCNDQCWLKWSEIQVNLWIASHVGSALTGYPDAYHPEEAA